MTLCGLAYITQNIGNFNRSAVRISNVSFLKVSFPKREEA
jgi:hypothetical protein